MEVEFLSSFSKDLNKLSSPSIRKSVKNLIVKIENAKTITEIPNVKKLAGYQTAY